MVSNTEIYFITRQCDGRIGVSGKHFLDLDPVCDRLWSLCVVFLVHPLSWALCGRQIKFKVYHPLWILRGGPLGDSSGESARVPPGGKSVVVGSHRLFHQIFFGTKHVPPKK